MEMILKMALIILALSHTAFASPFSTYEKWSSCAQDSDCIVTRAPCGTAAVHQQYLKDAEDYWRIEAPRVECSSPGPTDLSIFKATCGYAKIPCVKKNWLGMDAGIDHGSTCVSSEKKCLVSQ